MTAEDRIAVIVNEWFQTLPMMVEQQRDRGSLIRELIYLAERIERERDEFSAKYLEQLAGTRMVEDMRMREIGDLQRQLRTVRVEVAEGIAQAIEARARKIREEAWEPSAGMALAVVVEEDARIAREHGKEN
jgi:hypothetical protein